MIVSRTTTYLIHVLLFLSLKSCQPVVFVLMAVRSGVARLSPGRVLIETGIFILGGLWRLTEDPFIYTRGGKDKWAAVCGTTFFSFFFFLMMKKENGSHTFRCLNWTWIAMRGMMDGTVKTRAWGESRGDNRVSACWIAVLRALLSVCGWAVPVKLKRADSCTETS